MSLSKKIDLYKDFYAAGVYLSEAPSLPRFLFGVVKQFCRFWIWSENRVLNSCRIWFGIQHSATPPTPSPPSHTLCVRYLLYFDSGKGGG